MSTPPLLTFVTTCKGRLAHLQQSLPRLAGEAGARCVVVDYDCPDGTADWVGRNHPAVTIVRETSVPEFHIARARNLGARAATTPWLCFVDADVLVAPGFVAALQGLLQAGHFYRAAPRVHALDGTVVCAHADFVRAGGYDEVMRGWGCEDQEFCLRLQLLGLREQAFPGAFVESIEHLDAVRTRFYRDRDGRLSRAINRLYIEAKFDALRVTGELMAPADCAGIYQRIDQLLHATPGPDGAVHLQVDFRETNDVPGYRIRARLAYDVTRTDG